MNKQWARLDRANDSVIAVYDFIERAPRCPLEDDHPHRSNYPPDQTDAEYEALCPHDDMHSYILEVPVFVRVGWIYNNPGWDDPATPEIDHPE